MSLAPSLNSLLHHMHGSWQVCIFGSHCTTISVTPYNAVGLFLAGLSTLSFAAIYCFLQEPNESQRSKLVHEPVDEAGSQAKKSGLFWKSFLCLEVFVPLFVTFSFNASFLLIETGLAPAAHDALDWDPTSISTLFGINAVIIFISIILTIALSRWGMSDVSLLSTGLLVSTTGYTLMYLWWSRHASSLRFALPVQVAVFAFPFMGSTTRSIFTRTVDSKPELRYHQGTMQAILGMAASVAGFTAPACIATFILRTPAQVSESSDQREFNALALFAPVMSILCLSGVMYVHFFPSDKSDADTLPSSDLTTAIPPLETDYLLKSDGRDSVSRRASKRVSEPAFRFHPKTEAARRYSTMAMAIPEFEAFSGDGTTSSLLGKQSLGLNDDDFQ
jgi:hypothetical protein